MEYKIIIERRNRNENYEKELKEQRDRGFYTGHQNPQPIEYYSEKVLDVVLTEDEFDRVRKAALKEI